MPINEDFILTLIDKFSSAALVELKLDDGAVHIELRKEAACVSAGAAGLPPGGGFPTGGAASAGGSGPAAGGAAPFTGAAPVNGAGIEGLHLGLPAARVPGSQAGGGEAVTSPIVATFYASAQPDAPAFVTAGSRVKSGDTLCILEAMKMMNRLEAEFDCEIISVKVSSGDLVEYGQTLFEVKRL